MSLSSEVRPTSVLPGAGGARLIRWVCTNNPFYVVSAALFLAGLWISFGNPLHADETWALMGGLAGYTLLLAGAALVLVRFARIWDDARTVLLLVVLMFLATSVTFDEVLVFHPEQGFACYLGGLLFAVAVSEVVLHGIRLRLPAAYRIPYYLMLALFFLYPLALRPLLGDPRGEALMWGLFGFTPIAGLVFLTLLPAVWLGANCVRGNGSPWPWPMYPWSLFVFLGVAVPGRAFLLCWSMQLLGGADFKQLIFGAYFLIPFGLAVGILLLEMGRTFNRRSVLGLGLAMPAAMIGLSLVGHHSAPIYQEFRDLFAVRLGGDPLYLSLLAAVGYYVYAALRQAPLATEALTAALAALAIIGPDTLDTGDFVPLQSAPILSAAALQLGLGLMRRQSGRCLFAAVGVTVALVLTIPEELKTPLFQDVIAFHLGLVSVMLIGAAFNDPLARLLRHGAALLVFLACLTAIFARLDRSTMLPTRALETYPVAMAAILAGYGLRLGHRPSVVVANLVLICWLGALLRKGYAMLRQVVTGLDYLAVSLTLFGVAFLISLGKAGLLPRWFHLRRHGQRA